MTNEDIELAEEHIKLAEDIVMEQAGKADKPEKEKEFREAEFALEKAEAEIGDLKKEKNDQKSSP